VKTRKVPLASARGIAALGLVLPAILALALFRYYPVASAAWHSLFAWNGFTTGRFVGLANYRQLFRDPLMGTATLNIVRYAAIRVALNLAFPLAAAVLVFHAGAVRPRAGRAYQALLTIPLAVPLMVVLLLWKFIYSPGDGLLNVVLRGVGLDGLASDWLGGFDTSLYAIAGLGFPWVTGIGIAGFGLLLCLGGLQAIPAELFDAAAVDGVRPVGRFLRLELPLVAGQLRLIALLTIINTLQSYVPVMVLTMGGPGTSTLVPGLYLYQNAFSYDRFGYACAIGMAMAALLATLAFFQARAGRLAEAA
jgi:raffinose/stachyose/melibiose transport system permease protein